MARYSRYDRMITKSKSLQTIREKKPLLTDKTVRNYQMSVIYFCQAQDVELQDPDKCIAYILQHKEQLPNLFEKWLFSIAGQSPKNVRGQTNGVKAWLEVNGHVNEEEGTIPYWRMCLKKRHDIIKRGHTPERDAQRESLDLEIHDFGPAFLKGDRRGRAFLALTVTSGARQVSIRNLRWGDFKTMQSKKLDLSKRLPSSLDDEADYNGQPWLSYPVQFRQKRGSGSTGRFYIGMITREARDALIAWRGELKEWCKNEGISFNDETYVLPSMGKPTKDGKTINKGGLISREGTMTYFQRLIRDMTELKQLENGKDEPAFRRDGKPVTRHTITMHVCRRLLKNAVRRGGMSEEESRMQSGHAIKEQDMNELYGRGGLKKLQQAYDRAVRTGLLTIVRSPPTLEQLAENGEKKAIELAELKAKISALEAELEAVKNERNKQIWDMTKGIVEQRIQELIRTLKSK